MKIKNIYLDKVWETNPEFIRKYYENLPTNQKLCEEVKFILEQKITEQKIEISQIASRAKSIESFCEKIERKSYAKPFDQITDFAGVRIVYLYSKNHADIENIIKSEFYLVEKVDKTKLSHDTFGYGAVHYLVKLRGNYQGARYEKLQNKVCEIQVRTILQDAWAVVAHHLSYKQEKDIPTQLQRKLNALSGLFEIADDQFGSIKTAREEYQKQLSSTDSKLHRNALNEELNLDSLEAYLNVILPDRMEDINPRALSDLLHEIREADYNNFKEIDIDFRRGKAAAAAYEEDYPPSLEETSEPCKFNAIGFIRTSLELSNKKFKEVRGITINKNQRQQSYLKLVEDNVNNS